MQKPVWRMKIDCYVPLGLGELQMTKNGSVHAIERLTRRSGIYWRDTWGDWSIVAYQTNRTKPAKYRGV